MALSSHRSRQPPMQTVDEPGARSLTNDWPVNESTALRTSLTRTAGTHELPPLMPTVPPVSVSAPPKIARARKRHAPAAKTETDSHPALPVFGRTERPPHRDPDSHENGLQ
jgi:hypothetical protein